MKILDEEVLLVNTYSYRLLSLNVRRKLRDNIQQRHETW